MEIIRRSRSFYLLKNVYTLWMTTNKQNYALFKSRFQYCIDCWNGIYFENVRLIVLEQKHPIRYLYTFKVLKLFYLRSGQNLYR